jgi:hypothetical protein
MDANQQEALSHQHYGYWCVPLAGGCIAVFNHPNGNLLEICVNWDHVLEVPLPKKPTHKLTMETGVSIDDL